MTCHIFKNYCHKLEYEFTDETVLKLVKVFRNLSDDILKGERITMKIGKCFNKVSWDKLIYVLKETEQRVNLNISQIDTANIINR